MGICLSCLRGRDSGKSSTRRQTNESQPLLDDSNDMYGGHLGSSDGQADQLAQKRQQELSQVVQMTHEYFIDVSSMTHPDNAEAQADVAALREGIEKKAASIAIDLPKLRELIPEEHSLLQKGLLEVESESHKSLTPTASNPSQHSVSQAESQDSNAIPK